MSVSPEEKAMVSKESKSLAYISSRSEDDGILRFTISKVNVSIANGLRRTILSDIPTLVFKTFPHRENQAKIIVNTSRFNNEVIKQRLGCIPIHIADHTLPYDDLEVEIDKKNDTRDMIYVTTGDFRIRNTKSDKYLDEATVRKIFPSDPITGDFILLARLRPKISDEVPGEAISIKTKMSLHSAGEDGMYNVVSGCSYANSPDKIRQNDEWQELNSDLLSKENEPEIIAIKKSDWYSLGAKRFFLKDSFDFMIETLGVYSNASIIDKACRILITRLAKLKDIIKQQQLEIKAANSTIPNCFDVILLNEGYTIGKVLEYVLHYEFYLRRKMFIYVGFRKNHPHDQDSILRLALRKKVPDMSVSAIEESIAKACDMAMNIYDDIGSNFVK